MANQILRVFVNVNMQNGHLGLSKIAKAHKIDVRKLEAGAMVVFINARRTKMKVYTAENILSYISKDERLSLDVVRYFPQVFGASGRVNYDDALRLAVEKSLEGGQRKTLEVY